MPGHPLKLPLGRMLYVTVPSTFVGLIITCEAMESVPLPRYPVTLGGTAVAVQLKVVAGTFEVNTTEEVAWPEHMVWSIGLLVTVGDGLTFIVYAFGIPVQFKGPGPIGVTV